MHLSECRAPFFSLSSSFSSFLLSTFLPLYAPRRHCTISDRRSIPWQSAAIHQPLSLLTCSEVDGDVDHKDGVGNTVENDPVRGEVIVKEGDGNR